MKITRGSFTKFISALFIPSVAASGAFAAENLVRNGAFANGLSDWSPRGGTPQIVDIDGIKALRLQSGECEQVVSIPPGTPFVQLSLRMRCENVAKGNADWRTPRVAMRFLDQNGKGTGRWPAIFMCLGSTGWMDCHRVYEVPKGAVSLKLTPAQYGQGGTVDFQNFQLTALTAAEANNLPSGFELESGPLKIAEADLPSPDKLHIFILMGQSNMHGMADIDPAYLTPHPRVISMQPNGDWEPATPPLDRYRASGQGPGDSFAREYAELHPDVTVGLIQCAQAGSRIERLSPGGLASGRRPVYEEALALIEKAKKEGQLKAVLWQQGSSNCGDRDPYGPKLINYVETLRKDIGEPAIPFIAGELGHYTEEYRVFNRDLPDIIRQIPNSALVSAEGLNHRGDNVHFDTAGVIELGHRYLDAYRQGIEHSFLPGVSKSPVVVMDMPNSKE